MSAGIALQITAQDGLLKPLQRLLAKVERRAPLMAILAAYLLSSTRHRFETGIGPDGKRWKPSIRAQLTGGQTLVDKGIYRDRFTAAHSEDSAEVGTNDIRARLLHFGGEVRPVSAKALAFRVAGGNGMRFVQKVTIPARPQLGLDDDDRAEIPMLVRDYLRDQAA